jgi:hypothetical protein
MVTLGTISGAALHTEHGSTASDPPSRMSSVAFRVRKAAIDEKEEGGYCQGMTRMRAHTCFLLHCACDDEHPWACCSVSLQGSTSRVGFANGDQLTDSCARRVSTQSPP